MLPSASAQVRTGMTRPYARSHSGDVVMSLTCRHEQGRSCMRILQCCGFISNKESYKTTIHTHTYVGAAA